MLTEVLEGISRWAAEVGSLLDACRQLVEYYGTEEEADSFRSAVEGPLWLIGALKLVASESEVDTSERPPSSKFVCSEGLAEMVSPLLRIVVEWEPDFVAEARQTLDEEGWKRIKMPYGLFVGTVGTRMCDPLWTSFPRLAPPGWPA